MTVTKEPRALNPEEYMCPIYVHCILPAAPELFPISRAGGCTISSDAAHVHKDAALMHIPMETTEDVDDCRMFSIAVHSGHRITQPE